MELKIKDYNQKIQIIFISNDNQLGKCLNDFFLEDSMYFLIILIVEETKIFLGMDVGLEWFTKIQVMSIAHGSKLNKNLEC